MHQDVETGFYRLSMKLPVLGNRFVFGARIGSLDPKAITTADALMKELALTAKRGFGLAVEEAAPGLSSAASAIELADGRLGRSPSWHRAFGYKASVSASWPNSHNLARPNSPDLRPRRTRASGELHAPPLAAS